MVRFGLVYFAERMCKVYYFIIITSRLSIDWIFNIRQIASRTDEEVKGAAAASEINALKKKKKQTKSLVKAAVSN